MATGTKSRIEEEVPKYIDHAMNILINIIFLKDNYACFKVHHN